MTRLHRLNPAIRRRGRPSTATADLAMARKAMQAMVPQRLPTVEGLDMSSVYLPCPQVCGDLFDVVQISDDLLVFSLCGIEGKGISPAFAAAVAKVSFIRAVRSFHSPRPVLMRMIGDLASCLRNVSFAGAFVGVLDLHSNRLTYCGIGDLRPMVYKNDEAALRPLRLAGMAVRGHAVSSCHEHDLHLGPEDWLILSTNGVYRLYGDTAAGDGRRRFETELGAFIATATPAALAAAVRRKCAAAAARGGLAHDIALLAVEVLSDSRRNQILVRLGFEADSRACLRFISYFEEMDGAIGALLKDMDNLGYGDDTIRKMKITLTELLVNALYHGNRKDPSKRVTMAHVIDKKKVVVSVMDEGGGFDPASIPDPTLPENLTKDSGRGLYIVRSYVDEIRFNETGNRITITKYSSL